MDALDTPRVLDLIQQAEQSPNPRIRETADAARRELKDLIRTIELGNRAREELSRLRYPDTTGS